MVSIFHKYFSYETTTSVDLEYSHLPLPSITFCNVNVIRQSEIKKHGNEKALNEYKRLLGKVRLLGMVRLVGMVGLVGIDGQISKDGRISRDRWSD